MTHHNSPIGTRVRAAPLLLLILLLTPMVVQAQGISDVSVSQGSNNYVAVRVSLSGSASHFPATISVSWGDGSSSSTRAQDVNNKVKTVRTNYDNCGEKSISVSVSFTGGGSASRSASFTVGCDPAQPTVGGPIHCGLQGCRQVPDYFLDNERAKMRWIEEVSRRKERGDDSLPTLREFGYRCPDAGGYYCDTAWVPGPADTRGLSNPDSFVTSAIVNRPGANIQRISADGIGVKWINDQNPIDAIDVWGPGAEEGGEVCFHGTEGRLIYLDARTSPRAQSELATTVKGDEICGTMPGPGSVVYLPPASQT